MKRILSTLLLCSMVGACAGRGPRPTAPPSVPAPPPAPGTIQEGLASWYGLDEAGRPTASGEPMDPEAFTAAHLTFPFGTLLRVTDGDSGRSVMVVVNDRGPFVDNRILDLSYGAARALDMVRRGVAPVRIEVIQVDRSRLATRWRVQVGSFENESHAEELAYSIRSQGYDPVEVSMFRRNDRQYYRVWVGEYIGRSEAEDLAERLRREGRETVIMQTPFGSAR
ncbi:MAG TPA: septal ring lytic transglycosylase RlpA family protein [Vicinamibacteria bacterium]